MTSAAEAQQLLRDGRVSEAERAFQAILESDPEHVEALNVTGLIALRDGATGRALSLLGRAATLHAANPMTHHHLGLAHEASGDLQSAIASQRQAVQLAPEFHLARLHLGRLLQQAREPLQAAIQYARALQDAQEQGRWLNPDTTPAGLRASIEAAVLHVRRGANSSSKAARR